MEARRSGVRTRGAGEQEGPPGAGEWSLKLLGGATLHGPEGKPGRLGRRAAALLALLALEGPQYRARVARLLWPDAPEVTVRANLRQLLRRLREPPGPALVESAEESLRLAPHLEVDVLRLEERAASGRHAEVARMDGTLLAGLDYEDCPELAAWVQEARRHLDELRLRACEVEASRLESTGAVQAALQWNRRVLELEPTREEAYHRAMRLHLLLGDRSAALRAYARCRLVLQRELGVEPSEETHRLARSLERGQAPSATARPRGELPPTVLRPRVLAGRERVWHLLEEAWNARQAVFLSGEVGLGKSRLLSDFAASRRERTLLLQARPGDGAVPYALSMRWWRMLLAERPELGPALPAWVKRELARVLPELGELPSPSAAGTERLRLFEAQLELLRLAGREFAAILTDDLHQGDPASVEVLAYLEGRRVEHPELPRFLCTLSLEEAEPEVERLIGRMVDAGRARRVELEPLSLEEVGQLLSGVEVEEAPALAGPLTRHTGGNPLFVVETLKHLLEAGEQVPPLGPGSLPVPDRVRARLSRKLARLPREALQLARTVVVAGERFSLELAGEVLGEDPGELASRWEELAAARVLREGGLSHELYREVVRQEMPAPVHDWLHHRVREVLSARARGEGGR